MTNYRKFAVTGVSAAALALAACTPRMKTLRIRRSKLVILSRHQAPAPLRALRPLKLAPLLPTAPQALVPVETANPYRPQKP